MIPLVIPPSISTAFLNSAFPNTVIPLTKSVVSSIDFMYRFPLGLILIEIAEAVVVAVAIRIASVGVIPVILKLVPILLYSLVDAPEGFVSVACSTMLA